uniref:Uncharacterized protein n=1 Tax=Parascaris univalens TaxID=6257 RepID=A0A915A0A4_PARUN
MCIDCIVETLHKDITHTAVSSSSLFISFFDARCLRLSVASSQLRKDAKEPPHLWRPKKSFDDIRERTCRSIGTVQNASTDNGVKNTQKSF